MRPIVDGLQEEFGEEMLFVSLNAEEGNGEALFNLLSLPGHPSFVIFSAGNVEAYRTFGVFSDSRLRDAILDELSNPNNIADIIGGAVWKLNWTIVLRTP